MSNQPLKGVTDDNLEIIDVWADNLESEMARIRDAIESHPYVAMDTEFPGVVARPVGDFKTSGDYHYQTLRCNCDMLNLIQLGFCLADGEGRLPCVNGKYLVWQFNFREFSLEDDMYAQDSIELLKESGIDFAEYQERGMDVRRFAELLITSGVVLNDDVKWVTFHAGYDFGYLLKLLTASALPEVESEFFEKMAAWFPVIYDVKYLMKFTPDLYGGLNRLAETLDVDRIGPKHQAGSDSLVTLAVFLKLRVTHFKDEAEASFVKRFKGVLYGLGRDAEGRDEGNGH
jgi:CCR4-NOT transcription complex subunit 7/8